MSKRITLTVRVPITMILDAEQADGEINVVNVVQTYDPSAQEIMEALDHEGQLGDLDAAYEEAAGDAE